MSSGDRVAVVLCGQELSTSEKNLFLLLEFFGINSLRVSPGESNLAETVARNVGEAEYCLLSTSACFAVAMQGFRAQPEGEHPILASARSVFICDFRDNPESERILRFLTDSPTALIRRGNAARQSVSVSRDWPEFCGPMSGLEVSGVRVGGEPVFEIPQTSPQHQRLIAAGQADVFLKTLISGSPVFVASSAISIDLGTPVSGNFFDIKDYFIGAVPVVMYLRWAFQNRIWTHTEHSATLVVDDPHLKSRYGFLVFEDVLTLMRQHDFSTTIAFIPWNWRRTKPKTAELFLNNPDRYSLVVHGNDHTAGEFGTTSVERLDRKLRAASKRMEAHEKLTGVDWSRVMVFPQGVFSAESLAALKSNNFIAAVNTEVTPTGTGASKTEIVELWNTAIMKFSSFPVFTRRYMEHGIENFAFDMLLGKPCLMVAHHEVFKNRAQHLIEFVTALNSLNCSLRWRSLGEAVRRSFRKRGNRDGTMSVQMFASQMVLDNERNRVMTVHVSKRECNAAAVRLVTVNRQRIAWHQDVKEIRFSFDVPAGESVQVAVEYVGSPADNLPTETVGYRIKCGLRRRLSEFRDDYVCRSVFLSRCAAKLRRCLR
jgi:hypothetical protein